MPIFSEDLEPREENAMSPPPKPFHLADHERTLGRKLSEESIRTELCEGPIPESQSPRSRTPENEATTTCSDRAELIERLKRGESPTWIPNRHVSQNLLLPPSAHRNGKTNYLNGNIQLESIWNQRPATPTRNRNSKSTTTSPTLLPPADITPEKREGESEDETRLREGLNIERPRSALHSGDFTQDESSRNVATTKQSSHDGRSEENVRASGLPWLATSPPRNFTPFQFERSRTVLGRTEEARLSSSLSSWLSTTSFIYQPPTSPLVQSESNEDIDLASPLDGINLSSSMPRNSRRHTLMSSHSDSYGFSSPNPVSRQPPGFRQERTYPYQAHQPRRSLTSTPNIFMPGSSPQTPAFLRSRRPSYSSDSSPLQHASMVGSYEESILRGRMSTTPSKPLDFLAQIGVLGLGKCKSSLRCPPHVTLPFPAVFYSYVSSVAQGRSKDEDGPSPYVGQIDLENGLSNSEEEARSKRKQQNRAIERRLGGEGEMTDVNNGGFVDGSDRDIWRPQRPKKRSSSPRAPPGGSYRIPEKGQIQIIIKNPNKTAVKLFLIPYDLAGMEPGTKTFIRQRSYSTGPIIDVPELKDTAASERPILRYLVHLHICCPSRGRYYLYKSIRVVFANRVLDGKEKLRNEITLPEPRFTSYKPIRVMHPSIMAGTGPGASLAADKAFRRRSSGFYFGALNPTLDAVATHDGFMPDPMPPPSHFSLDFAGHNNQPIDPIPFRLPTEDAAINTSGGGILNHSSRPSDIHSIGSSLQTSRPTTQDSNNMSNWGGCIDNYDKLSKGDVGYGGNAFSGIINGSPAAAEGLLSQRLRTLGVEAPQAPQAPQARPDSNMTDQ